MSSYSVAACMSNLPKRESIPTPKPSGNTRTLTKVGHFANGVLSNTGMIGLMQPAFTLKTYRMSGLGIPPARKLYAGIGPNTASGGPAEGIAFLSEEILSKTVKSKTPSELENFGSSLAAGAIAAPVNAACERVMIQQQIHGKRAMEIVRRDLAVGKIFQGTIPTVGRDSIFNVGVFALNDWMKIRLKGRFSNEKAELACSGMLSGGIAGFASSPFDYIKTKMQSDPAGNNGGMLQTAKVVIREAGARELFKGSGIRSGLIAGAVCSINFFKEWIPALLPKFLYEQREP